MALIDQRIASLGQRCPLLVLGPTEPMTTAYLGTFGFFSFACRCSSHSLMELVAAPMASKANPPQKITKLIRPRNN